MRAWGEVFIEAAVGRAEVAVGGPMRSHHGFTRKARGS
jgi:hypothetical protein